MPSGFMPMGHLRIGSISRSASSGANTDDGESDRAGNHAREMQRAERYGTEECVRVRERRERPGIAVHDAVEHDVRIRAECRTNCDLSQGELLPAEEIGESD